MNCLLLFRLFHCAQQLSAMARSIAAGLMCATTFFVFFPAPARARIVAADFLDVKRHGAIQCLLQMAHVFRLIRFHTNDVMPSMFRA